ncbi:TSUP family transporter [Saccharibacter sp. 17.LH.SD]|uniref:sulfite exporter TauE/SafE family protein n=1 Tax=Saccharibacter sp. 17.LH.SD TaxID=2689393 RepID=UPI001370A847|nr:sulfite exporter TauE/SafE family protein [Saccharibacter sp. 17.LH.SD]MXV44024.1 TSUP family transporter [Saccharibacter sp. 17.LH.SD]
MVHGWVYVLSGLLVGFLVGMTGVGGGSLMTPILILLCGVKPQTAVGTDLIYAAVTKLVGTTFNRHLGTIDWRIVGWLMAGSIPGALICLIFLHHTGSSAAVSHIIHVALGISLLITSPAILFRPYLQRWASQRAVYGRRRVRFLTVVLGLILGGMVALSSVGAGAIGMAALVMLYPSVPMRTLVAVDVAHAVPLAFVAGGGHWLEGALDVRTIAWLLCGSIPGILLGTLCAGKCHEAVQRWVLGVLLAVIGLRMI